MTVIDFAEMRMEQEERTDENLVRYWSAYLDGARSQMKEDGSDLGNVQRACLILIRELYKTEPCGGDLHIVTDDGNIENGSLEWSESFITRNGKAETEIGRLELSILRLLRMMTLDEREEVVGR